MQPLWTKVWIFISKLRIKLIYEPAIPFWDIYLQDLKTTLQKDVCIPLLIATLSTVAKSTIVKIINLCIQPQMYYEDEYTQWNTLQFQGKIKSYNLLQPY